MHNNLYKPSEQKFEVDFAKSLIIIVTLLLTFVIPIQVVTYLKSQPISLNLATNTVNNTQKNTQSAPATSKGTSAGGTTTSGKVAGASTVKGIESINIPIINQTIDLNSQTGLLILLGTFLIGISVLLVLYLVIDGAREDEFKKHYK